MYPQQLRPGLQRINLLPDEDALVDFVLEHITLPRRWPRLARLCARRGNVSGRAAALVGHQRLYCERAPCTCWRAREGREWRASVEGARAGVAWHARRSGASGVSSSCDADAAGPSARNFSSATCSMKNNGSRATFTSTTRHLERHLARRLREDVE